MAHGKRASMREGPLAALFRKTTQDDTDEQAAPPKREEQPREPVAQERPPRPHHRARFAGDDDEPHIPSAKERLSAAFSHDIPHDVLERPARREYRPRDEPSLAPAKMRGPVLRVIGVGGAGVNAVNRMVEVGTEGVEFIAVNTDLQSLEESSAHVTLHIGAELTHGLGSGSDPSVGRQAALSDDDRIKSLMKGSDMVFVTAGAGGGTGTGAAPVVAQIAQRSAR